MLSNFVFALLMLIQTTSPATILHEPKCSPVASNLVFQSADGGLTWQDVSSGLPHKLEVTNIIADGEELILSSANGIYRSPVKLKSPMWKKDVFLNDKISGVFSGRSGRFARNFDNGFYREVQNTGTWLPIFKNLNGVWKWAVLECPNEHILLGTDHGIYKSSNHGQSWNLALGDEKVFELVQKDKVILANSTNGILRSTDSGETWNWVLRENNMFRNIGVIGEQLYAITNEDEASKDKNSNQKGMANKLLISSDHGQSWKRIDSGLEVGRYVYLNLDKTSSNFINDLTQVGNFMVCSIDSGIFRSADGGKTWERVLTTKENHIFNFSSTGHMIYAVKANRGC
ncbi:MAG: hypothetical protein IPM92_04450 [Saprospiraceae bacterium]|nr:hypothetical protein [Saprospiraceae bacterium]